jgi:LexA-binding, inner membrane-associated putative hydrolase
MLFVGHISIAFLLRYAISKKFVLKDVSISFVMFLSTLPDIDLVFRLLGIEVGHRSITHSAIIWTIVALAFLTISGGIRFNAISDTIIEGILFAMMAIIIIKQNLHKDNGRQHTLLCYYSTLNRFFYPILIAEIIMSPTFFIV